MYGVPANLMQSIGINTDQSMLESGENDGFETPPDMTGVGFEVSPPKIP